jgi:flagellar export protein FliJ
MESILEIYKKSKDRQITELKKELAVYNFQLKNLDEEILKLETKVNKLKTSIPSSIIELELQNKYFLNILYKIDEYKKEKEKIEEKIDKIKEQLSLIFGEKKAVEKYEIKIKKKREKEAEKKLSQLADDIFNNRRFNI